MCTHPAREEVSVYKYGPSILIYISMLLTAAELVDYPGLKNIIRKPVQIQQAKETSSLKNLGASQFIPLLHFISSYCAAYK